MENNINIFEEAYYTYFENMVTKACQGDNDALHHLCQEISERVFVRIIQRIPNRMDAEDIVQEVMIRVCSGIKDLKEPKAFIKWLNNIIINEVNRYNKNKAQMTASISLEQYQDIIETEDKDFLPFENVISKEDSKLVMKIVNSLPERQMEAVKLYYYSGMTKTETAAEMKIGLSTVVHYLDIAKTKIKTELEKTVEVSGFTRNLAVLPIGSLLRESIQLEVHQLYSLNEIWIKQLVSQGTEAAEAAVTKVTGGKITGGIISAIAAGLVVILVAIIIVVVGIYDGDFFRKTYETSSKVIIDLNEASGTIILVDKGGQESAVNPVDVIVGTYSEYGEVKITGWRITTKDNDLTLFSGDGDNVSEVLLQLQSDMRFGEYWLILMLEDLVGGTYRLSRSFVIKQD